MTISSSLTSLSDRDLLATGRRLAADERQATTQLIASLAELDARRLYLGEGCSSLFTYCTQVLHLSEHAAYGRIEAARAAGRFPIILDRLNSGDLTLTAVGLLASHLTSENHRELLDAARHKSKREVERLIAAIRPQLSVPSSVRKVPSPVPRPLKPAAERLVETIGEPSPTAPLVAAAVSHPPPRPSVVRPIAPERYKVQFTVDGETFSKLRRAQDLMRHRVPDGDVAVIVDAALTLLLERLERTKLAAASRTRTAQVTQHESRHVPAAVRRHVWARDQGRCAFVGTQGRCTERGFLEFHHVAPYAAGGSATAENIELRCRAHNQYEADQFFGRPEAARECSPMYAPLNSVRTESSVRHFIGSSSWTLRDSSLFSAARLSRPPMIDGREWAAANVKAASSPGGVPAPIQAFSIVLTDCGDRRGAPAECS